MVHLTKDDNVSHKISALLHWDLGDIVSQCCVTLFVFEKLYLLIALICRDLCSLDLRILWSFQLWWICCRFFVTCVITTALMNSDVSFGYCLLYQSMCLIPGWVSFFSAMRISMCISIPFVTAMKVTNYSIYVTDI